MIFLHLLEVGYESPPMDYHFGMSGTMSTPQDPNLGHILSTPGTPHLPKSVPDLMRYYQGSYLTPETTRIPSVITYIPQGVPFAHQSSQEEKR